MHPLTDLYQGLKLEYLNRSRSVLVARLMQEADAHAAHPDRDPFLIPITYTGDRPHQHVKSLRVALTARGYRFHYRYNREDQTLLLWADPPLP